MDKSLFKVILCKYYNSKITLEQIKSFLTEFCQEQKPDIKSEEVKMVLFTITAIPPLLEKCLLFALEYYKRKFAMIELISEEGKIIKFI